MSALRSRLAKLETRTTGQGRIFTVRSSSAFTEAEIRSFLAEEGHNPTTADRVLHLRTTFDEDKDNVPGGGPDAWIIAGMRLIGVHARGGIPSALAE